MKIRKGFVSNSSSSSFIIAYDKKGILTDPKEIVDFIENHPRRNIMFVSEMAEGLDAFTLDMHQKNYLLKHKKRFIQYNSDPVKIIDYDADPDENGNYPEIEAPAVTAYTCIYEFIRDPNEYITPEVDMSDVPYEEMTVEENMRVLKGDSDEKLIHKYEESLRYYQIREDREREALKEIRKEFLDSTKNLILSRNDNPEDLDVKYISVDDGNCDPDGNCEYEFASRYFGLEEDTYFEKIGDPNLEEEPIEEDRE